jgi:hypothetical protein
MLKLKLKWEYETGEVFEDWTRPFEIAWAEKDLYKGESIIKILGEQSVPSNELLLFLGHKIATRVDKPAPFDKWQKQIVDIQLVNYEFPKAFGSEVSAE